MKNKFRISGVILIILPIFLIHSCKKEEKPTLTTSAITNITGTTATSGGTITNEGSGTVISRGVCWSIGSTPTISNSKTVDGAGAGSFISNMSSLNVATTYYVRAYATNSVGTGYGMAMSFSTMGKAPTALTNSATNITTSSATLNGLINANYLSTVVTFEYGTTTNYGNSLTISQNPITGNIDTAVSANASGLLGGTVYHFRVKTVNSIGTIYGDDMSFTTLGQLPTASTQAATNILQTTTTLNGIVNPNYLQTTVTFEYGTTTNYSSIISAEQNPVSDNSNVSVTANINGLTVATIYHFRVKAVNSLGTSYGNDMTFITKGPITDIDGNLYNTIIIGTQVWMVENLKTTKYSDETKIAYPGSDNIAWQNNTAGAYAWYNNDSATYKATYGALYNWYAVNTSKLCPIGWHVSTNADWTTLANFIGGDNIAGGKLKETGTTHWNSPNTGATNETGFTALPGGYCLQDETFVSIGYDGIFWSSTVIDAYTAWFWAMDRSTIALGMADCDKTRGLSVRCVRDN
jgi:uncharacterized protein (TIGR02145 family)